MGDSETQRIITPSDYGNDQQPSYNATEVQAPDSNVRMVVDNTPGDEPQSQPPNRTNPELPAYTSGYDMGPSPPDPARGDQHHLIDDRPLPTRTRMGEPVQTGRPPPGLVDINYCLDSAAYSKYHSFTLTAACLAMIASGSQVFLTCVIQAFANCKFELDSSERTWLLCSIFLLYPFGAVFLGWAADQWGRKWTLIISLYLVLITGIIQVFASAWWVLFLTRLFMGFFLPGITTLPLIFWLEISARNHREEGTLALLCLFGTGAAYDFCLAAIFTSVSETYAYEFICGLSIFPVLLAVFFAHFTIESPRWLGVGSTLKETNLALKEYGYESPRPDQDTPIDIYYVYQRGNICLVFKYMCCAASLFSTLFFCSLYLEFGTVIIIPYMFYWDYCELGFKQDASVLASILDSILDVFIGEDCVEIDLYSFLYLLVISGCIIVGLLVGYFTQQYFGSRITLITYSITSTVIYAFLDICWSYIATIIEIVAGLIFIMATQYSMFSSILIQSPTFMRASAVGYADAWGKLGALSAVAICSQMGDRHLLDIVFWSFLAVGILLIFFVCLVSLEAKDAIVYDNLPADNRANEPPPLCLPPGPPPPRHPPPPPPPGQGYYDYPPPPGYRAYYY